MLKIAFGLEELQAAKIVSDLSTEIAFRTDREGKLDPVLFLNEISTRYEGVERDYAIYTLGRVYGEHQLMRQLERGNKVHPTVQTMMDVLEGFKFSTLKEFQQFCRDKFQKIHHMIKGEEILSSVNKKDDNEENS